MHNAECDIAFDATMHNANPECEIPFDATIHYAQCTYAECVILLDELSFLHLLKCCFVVMVSFFLSKCRYTGPKAVAPEEDARDSAFARNEDFWGTYKVGCVLVGRTQKHVKIAAPVRALCVDIPFEMPILDAVICASSRKQVYVRFCPARNKQR